MACAKQTTPTGGPKDITPPIALSTNPPQFSTFFEGNSVEFVFDEYIQVQDFAGQLIVSPTLKETPTYKLRGKKLEVTWTDTLLTNTTYQFNFGKAVVDLNEGNPNTDLVYVISTGSYIDSLSITGKVLRAIDNAPLKAGAVMIYSEDVDSLPLTRSPDYFALTDSSGVFRLKYLPQNEFKLFVLAEEGNNYKYDGPPEIIGFLDYKVASSYEDSVSNMVIPAFIEADTTQYIKSTITKDYGYYEVVFNIPTTDPVIRFFDVETEEQLPPPLSVLNERRDTLRNWVKLPDREDLEEIEVILTDGEILNDTNFWYIERDPKFKDKAPLAVSSNATRNKLDIGGTFDLLFSEPLAEADTSLIYLMEDSVRVYPQGVEKSNLSRKLTLSYPFKALSTYIITTQAGAFLDIFGTYSDSTVFSFSLQEADFYGNFTVDILFEKPLKSGSARVQLGDKGGLKKEVRLTGSQKLNFGRMSPGEYSLKIIFDENDNGKWDTGNYAEKIQPEKVSIYSEPIKIRSNWDLDIEWKPIISFPD